MSAMAAITPVTTNKITLSDNPPGRGIRLDALPGRINPDCSILACSIDRSYSASDLPGTSSLSSIRLASHYHWPGDPEGPNAFVASSAVQAKSA
jgi:hypothetical protein